MSNKGSFSRPKELTILHSNSDQDLDGFQWTTLDFDVVRINTKGYANLANNGIDLPPTIGKYWYIEAVITFNGLSNTGYQIELMEGANAFYNQAEQYTATVNRKAQVNHIVEGSVSLGIITVRLYTLGDLVAQNGIGRVQLTAYRLF